MMKGKRNLSPLPERLGQSQGEIFSLSATKSKGVIVSSRPKQEQCTQHLSFAMVKSMCADRKALEGQRDGYRLDVERLQSELKTLLSDRELYSSALVRNAQSTITTQVINACVNSCQRRDMKLLVSRLHPLAQALTPLGRERLFWTIWPYVLDYLLGMDATMAHSVYEDKSQSPAALLQFLCVEGHSAEMRSRLIALERLIRQRHVIIQDLVFDFRTNLRPDMLFSSVLSDVGPSERPTATIFLLDLLTVDGFLDPLLTASLKGNDAKTLQERLRYFQGQVDSSVAEYLHKKLSTLSKMLGDEPHLPVITFFSQMPMVQREASAVLADTNTLQVRQKDDDSHIPFMQWLSQGLSSSLWKAFMVRLLNFDLHESKTISDLLKAPSQERQKLYEKVQAAGNVEALLWLKKIARQLRHEDLDISSLKADGHHIPSRDVALNKSINRPAPELPAIVFSRTAMDPSRRSVEPQGELDCVEILGMAARHQY